MVTKAIGRNDKMQIIFFFFFFFYTAQCNLSVDYYTKLIEENKKKALNYTLPESNEEFRKGYESSEINDFGSYDFIIIGAGSAGSVVAARLSEISSWKILVIEAGGEEDDFSLIPSVSMSLAFSPKNWGYYSIPCKTCFLGLKNRETFVPRGKSLGGTSAINGVIYTRGNGKDFDTWAKLGNPGWSFREVLPYYLKSENSQTDGDSGYHRSGGYYNVEYAYPVVKDFASLIDAGRELNMSYVDYNGRKQLGVSRKNLNIIHGKRLSTSEAFLNKARKRSNLKLLTKALATRIIIDKTKKTARGVEFVRNDQKFVAWASKEVILSGGVINSPQLLMLSGIGPKNHLKKFQIETIEDLPVGKNLMDHLRLRLLFRTNYTADLPDLKEQIEDYLAGTGILTNQASDSDFVFLHFGNLPEGMPMAQYRILPPTGSEDLIVQRFSNFNGELNKNYLGKLNSKSDFQLYISFLHEKSRGKVTLKSNSPIDFPNIDFNYFSEHEDVDNVIEAINLGLKITQTKTFKRINSTLIDFPICLDFEKYSKSFWKCIVRHIAMTDHHLSSTNRMGSDKKSSVVDTNLKVHGVNKLRVVDASVFPVTVSGNINAAVVMVAEKISDVIKTEYGFIQFVPV